MRRNRFSPVAWAILIGTVLSGTGCRTDSPDPSTPDTAASGRAYHLSVLQPQLRLWSEPGLDGEVLARLPQGTRLLELGPVSDFTSRIQLEGENYDEPWIKVRAEDGAEGWVYARRQDFQLLSAIDSLAWSYEKRLTAYLGKEVVDQLSAYRQAYRQVRSATDFVAVYRQGVQLRDEMVRRIEAKTAMKPLEELPDLFWLDEMMPGFVPQLVAEGTAYHLFADFREWSIQARRTAEAEDDSFVDLCLYIFPQDSVEYFFPVWQIQTWDYGGHSLLGRGYHLGTLRLMDDLYRKTQLFEPDLRNWRAALIDDITKLEVTYWEERQSALKELDQILVAGFACLTKEDRIALDVRRQQMENAEKYGIEFNHQSGVY